MKKKRRDGSGVVGGGGGGVVVEGKNQASGPKSRSRPGKEPWSGPGRREADVCMYKKCKTKRQQRCACACAW